MLDAFKIKEVYNCHAKLEARELYELTIRHGARYVKDLLQMLGSDFGKSEQDVWDKLEELEFGSVVFECKAGPFVEHEVEGILELPESQGKDGSDLSLEEDGVLVSEERMMKGAMVVAFGFCSDLFWKCAVFLQEGVF